MYCYFDAKEVSTDARKDIALTQLLGYADGSLSQGFSTLYGLEILNKNLLVKGKVVA